MEGQTQKNKKWIFDKTSKKKQKKKNVCTAAGLEPELHALVCKRFKPLGHAGGLKHSAQKALYIAITHNAV